MMMRLQQHSRNQPLYLRNGSYTSVRLELIFFYALRLIAHNRGLSMSDLIREIEGHPRNPRRSFTSALRCYVVEQLHPHYAVTGPRNQHLRCSGRR
jgi:predicted DNA-binding ribbon-helix-helix protein